VGLPASSSLTLRALFKAAAAEAALGRGVPGGRVSGLSLAAQAFFAAAAALETRVVLIVPADGSLERTTADVRFFLGALAGWSDEALERGVLPLPSQEVDPFRDLPPHFQVASARARALWALASGEARVVVASAEALLPRLSAPERLLAASVTLSVGGRHSPPALGDLLAEAGFTWADPVEQPGEFCVRGGVVDFFPAGDGAPVRVEFLGDTIESLRRFDPATQRSVEALDQASVVPVRELVADRQATFFDYLAGGPPVKLLASEMADIEARVLTRLEQLAASFADAVERGRQVPPPETLVLSWADLARALERAVRLETLAIEEGPAGVGSGERTARTPADRHIRCEPVPEFRGRIPEWVRDVARARARGDTVVVVVRTPGRAERVVELLGEYGQPAGRLDRAEPPSPPAVLVATGGLSRGFRLPDAALQLYAEDDLFAEERRAPERRRPVAGAFLSDFRDLKTGDHVVHVEHGIGQFVGLRQLPIEGELQEFMELRYAGGDKLFVPVERLDLVQKYTGSAHPTLDHLGGTTWERAKTRVRKAMREMAEELLKLYAARKAIRGHAFSPDTHWQREFEDAFEYELTPDQRTAIAEIKRDMESPVPMDRLLCGDVGYGKTEVAMRAAFKAVMDGKQVALLAPTTVLAFQHYRTLTARFAAFPVRVELVSRFRPPGEQRQVLADLAAGRVDIVVGTHRLLSRDVEFRDLGLVIIDEEQRFGVAHKERLKQLRRKVDVLTMTATPIPRTLNMALAGIRDMSVIETPPKDRLAIQTSVVRFDPLVIAQAIRNELARGGQVYFVHNRVESIYAVGDLVQRLVPEARIAVAHGQMSEQALERTMVDFIAHRFDVLLATTIIENGLDIANVNTILINHAEQFGLAELYQLRGRVGRSDRPAYAYLLVPPEETLSPLARRRLAAIREFSELGSGFRLAALDLEIRGAGNLLGPEQSGHIEAVGFDLYMKLLEQTVRELKGERLEEETRAAVNLKVDLRIEERYIPDTNQRLAAYRRVAAARTEQELARLVEEWRDRYGPLPPSVENLVAYGRIRILADRLGIDAIDREGRTILIKFKREPQVDPARLLRLVRERGDLTLLPPGTLKLDLERAARPGARGSAPAAGQRPAASEDERGSWWTRYATEGEVRAGLSKQAALRRTEPREGIVDRVVALLEELSGEQRQS
jgi:transcription-repair coupling factor (superfamily II helicase)